MARADQKNVTIIKRRKVIAAGHHGGAWKVAYADFVTAMMAFFLLMWLLSVSDEETKLGLADYFSPTVPIHSTRGGGDGPFAGASMFSQDVLARDETGRKGDPAMRDAPDGREPSLADLENQLLGASGDAVGADPLLDQIRTRVTDEGLIIEVFDVEGSPLFEADGAAPTAVLERLLAMVGRLLARTENSVAVTGHLARADVGADRPDPWRLSADRAHLARGLLVAAGVAEARVDRVTGRADRSPVAGGDGGGLAGSSAGSPAAGSGFGESGSGGGGDARNRRIEITLLRGFAP